MHASYIEFDLEINQVITKFYIYENELDIFIYIGQFSHNVSLFNKILSSRLKKIEPIRSKNSIIFCKLTDESFLNIIEKILIDLFIGESVQNIKNKFNDTPQAEIK
ncbi:hypothetical protein H311_00652 [Anncaliia algerae PRA109]|nr:hypothetical protein H311_00652 [Anncaliia algerae PRA109]